MKISKMIKRMEKLRDAIEESDDEEINTSKNLKTLNAVITELEAAQTMECEPF